MWKVRDAELNWFNTVQKLHRCQLIRELGISLRLYFSPEAQPPSRGVFSNRAPPDQKLNLQKYEGTLWYHDLFLPYRLPETTFPGIGMRAWFAVCCKHGGTDSHCAAACVSVELDLSNMSHRASCEGSTVHAQRSPVSECLLLWGWPESNACCLDNWMFVRSAHLTCKKKKKVVMFIYLSFFFSLVEQIVVSIYTRKLYISWEKQLLFELRRREMQLYSRSEHWSILIGWNFQLSVIHFSNLIICLLALEIITKLLAFQLLIFDYFQGFFFVSNFLSHNYNPIVY